MSQRSAHWLLFVTLVSVAPLPFYAAVANGSAPALRLAVLAGASAALLVAEGSHGMVGIFAALFGIQASVYAALLWFAAGGLARILGRFTPRRRALAAIATAAIAIALAAAAQPYRTPFHGETLRAPLWRILG